jgi:hypothetical protein
MRIDVLVVGVSGISVALIVEVKLPLFPTNKNDLSLEKVPTLATFELVNEPIPKVNISPPIALLLCL